MKSIEDCCTLHLRAVKGLVQTIKDAENEDNDRENASEEN